MTLRFRAGAATDVGRVRDHNEDGYLVDDTLGLIAVADGMGGHRGGEVASAAALDALRIAFGAGATIDGAVATANEIVHEQSLADRNLRGMGTTLTAGALGIDGTLTLGHVGDSRAYLVRDGELARITTDHSLVEELIRAGELTEEEAERDPRRSRITRALGLEPSVTVDLESVDLRDGDRLLLCSDGLTTMVREDEIAALVVDEDDPEEVARRLVDTANEHGGVDNITVVIIDIQEDGEELPEPDDSDDATDEDETMLVEAVSDGTEDDSPASENETPKKKRGLGRFFRRGK
ncbi:MAG: Stp1/IreP family PP2C-type Ser/Thr phosphatase [Acidimicrobiia bacterium]